MLRGVARKYRCLLQQPFEAGEELLEAAVDKVCCVLRTGAPEMLLGNADDHLLVKNEGRAVHQQAQEGHRLRVEHH